MYSIPKIKPNLLFDFLNLLRLSENRRVVEGVELLLGEGLFVGETDVVDKEGADESETSKTGCRRNENSLCTTSVQLVLKWESG